MQMAAESDNLLQDRAGDRTFQLYETLRARILDGTYVEGGRLKEAEIAAEFHVSRTPVREALRQLGLDGLVNLEPNRGAVVKELTDHDIRQILDLRAVVEAFGAGQAALNMEPQALDSLESLFKVQVRTGLKERGQRRASALVSLNVEFHRQIMLGSGSNRLVALFRNVILMPTRSGNAFWSSARDRQSALVYHREIVQAIRAKDKDRAEAAMRSHIYAAKDFFLAQFRPPAP